MPPDVTDVQSVWRTVVENSGSAPHYPAQLEFTKAPQQRFAWVPVFPRRLPTGLIAVPRTELEA